MPMNVLLPEGLVIAIDCFEHGVFADRREVVANHATDDPESRATVCTCTIGKLVDEGDLIEVGLRQDLRHLVGTRRDRD